MQPGRRVLLDHEAAALRRRHLGGAARLGGLFEIPFLAVGGELAGGHDDPPLLTQSYHGTKRARNPNPRRRVRNMAGGAGSGSSTFNAPSPLHPTPARALHRFAAG